MGRWLEGDGVVEDGTAFGPKFIGFVCIHDRGHVKGSACARMSATRDDPASSNKGARSGLRNSSEVHYRPAVCTHHHPSVRTECLSAGSLCQAGVDQAGQLIFKYKNATRGLPEIRSFTATSSFLVMSVGGWTVLTLMQSSAPHVCCALRGRSHLSDVFPSGARLTANMRNGRRAGSNPSTHTLSQL